jgi:hypothetical protein
MMAERRKPTKINQNAAVVVVLLDPLFLNDESGMMSNVLRRSVNPGRRFSLRSFKNLPHNQPEMEQNPLLLELYRNVAQYPRQRLEPVPKRRTITYPLPGLDVPTSIVQTPSVLLSQTEELSERIGRFRVVQPTDGRLGGRL